MNRLVRLAWLMFLGRSRGPVSGLGPCRTPFRVMPTDLDVLGHMNNGIYFSLMDLGRMDLMARARLLKPLASRGWYPVVVAETMQFRRSLKLFEQFAIVTRVLTWDDQVILLEQRFERGGETIAWALVRARFLKKAGGSVTATEIMELAGIAPDTPRVDLPAAAANWYHDFASWQGPAEAKPGD